MLAAWMTTVKPLSLSLPRNLARLVEREAAQLIVAAAEAGLIGIEQTAQSLRLLFAGFEQHRTHRFFPVKLVFLRIGLRIR